MGVDFVRIDLVGGYQPDVRAVCLEILHSIVKRQTIVVAGTYGSALLPFKLHVGYNKCSIPRHSRAQFNRRSRRSPC